MYTNFLKFIRSKACFLPFGGHFPLVLYPRLNNPLPILWKSDSPSNFGSRTMAADFFLELHFFDDFRGATRRTEGGWKSSKKWSSRKSSAAIVLDPKLDGESDFQRVRSSKWGLKYNLWRKWPKNTILGRVSYILLCKLVNSKRTKFGRGSHTRYPLLFTKNALLFTKPPRIHCFPPGFENHARWRWCFARLLRLLPSWCRRRTLGCR